MVIPPFIASELAVQLRENQDLQLHPKFREPAFERRPGLHVRGLPSPSSSDSFCARDFGVLNQVSALCVRSCR